MSSLKSCSKGFRASPRILLQVFPIKVWLQALPPKSDSKDFHRNLAPRVSHEVWLHGFDPKSCSKNYPLKSCSKGVPRSLALRDSPEVLRQVFPLKSSSTNVTQVFSLRVSPEVLLQVFPPEVLLQAFSPKSCSKSSSEVLFHETLLRSHAPSVSTEVLFQRFPEVLLQVSPQKYCSMRVFPRILAQ